MRDDLSRGVLAAQVAHAAARSGPHGPQDHVVVLQVSSAKLAAMLDALRDADPVAIAEPDPPWNGELMAIGIPPIRREAHPTIVRVLARLQLVR